MTLGCITSYETKLVTHLNEVIFVLGYFNDLLTYFKVVGASEHGFVSSYGNGRNVDPSVHSEIMSW